MLRYISPQNGNCEQARLLESAKNDTDMFLQASAMQQLCKLYKFTQSSLSKYLNISQSTVGNKIRLLSYTPQERARILEYRLTERHARALLRVQPPKRAALINLVGNMQLNVRQTEELVEKCRSDMQYFADDSSWSASSIDTFFENIVSAAQSLQEDHVNVSCMTEHGDGWQRITVTVKSNIFS